MASLPRTNIEGYLAFIKALLDRDDDDLVECSAANRGADGTFPFPLSPHANQNTVHISRPTRVKRRERKRGELCFLPNFHLSSFSPIPTAEITKWVSKWVACDLEVKVAQGDDE